MNQRPWCEDVGRICRKIQRMTKGKGRGAPASGYLPSAVRSFTTKGGMGTRALQKDHRSLASLLDKEGSGGQKLPTKEDARSIEGSAVLKLREGVVMRKCCAGSVKGFYVHSRII